MHILVAGQDRKECEAYRAVLCSLGHTVAVAHAAGAIGHAVSQGQALDVAVVCDPVPDWVSPFRDQSDRHIYVIASLERMSGREVRAAWQMDVDDIMSSKASPDEIAGRVDALERIRHWVHSMGDGFALSGTNVLSDLNTLVQLPGLLGSEFGQMLGADFENEVVSEIPSMEYAAEICLALVSDDVELTIGVGLVKGAVPSFSAVVFGESVGHDVMADALREFANTAGGSVKRGVDSEGRTLSLGLPVDAMYLQPSGDARAWRLYVDELQLWVWVSARDETPQRLSASMLREGMVISKPVKNGAGVLLVPEGTVLTERTVSRLLQLLGPSTLVEVSRAA